VPSQAHVFFFLCYSIVIANMLKLGRKASRSVIHKKSAFSPQLINSTHSHQLPSSPDSKPELISNPTSNQITDINSEMVTGPLVEMLSRNR
jgi:hypothetical protein